MLLLTQAWNQHNWYSIQIGWTENWTFYLRCTGLWVGSTLWPQSKASEINSWETFSPRLYEMLLNLRIEISPSSFFFSRPSRWDSLSLPPHILYSLSVHNVGNQGRWVPLGNSLAIIKQHKPLVFRGLSEFHPKKLSLSTSPSTSWISFFV